jgi:hypothetical protein
MCQFVHKSEDMVVHGVTSADLTTNDAKKMNQENLGTLKTILVPTENHCTTNDC